MAAKPQMDTAKFTIVVTNNISIENLSSKYCFESKLKEYFRSKRKPGIGIFKVEFVSQNTAILYLESDEGM